MKKSCIELTALLLDPLKGRDIGEVDVSETSPVCVTPIDGYMQAFYGFQGKQGVSLAGKQAIAQGKSPVTVTIEVKLDKPILREYVTIESLSRCDFVNLMRPSREMIDFLADYWWGKLEEKGWSKSDLEKVDWSFPSRFLYHDESILADLLAEPEWQHLKLVAYPAQAIGGQVSGANWVTVGLFRRSTINEAYLQYKPDSKLKID